MIITSRLDQNKIMLLKNIFYLGFLKSSYQTTKINIIRAILSKRLTVLEETLINKKGFFTLVRRSAELTLKPLGISLKKKRVVLRPLITIKSN